jgi:tetratricopeptide (TPR) repeat protein
MQIPFPKGARPGVACLCALLAVSLAAAGEEKQTTGKVPITTPSKEAKDLYLKGRDLSERLRATDAREMLKEAVAKDESFALGHLALANTAPSAKEFFASLKRAVELAPKVTDAERDMILGLDAGVRSDPEAQRKHYTKLAAAFPNDERVHNLLGGYYFGRQEYEAAIAEYQKAIAINPGFSQPYNQMGYAYRFLERYDEAQTAFKKYIELIPDDPNPYDSYAELLMKRGRFQESIDNYEKALAVKRNFVASYVGIGLNQVLMGQPEKARETYARLTQIARNNGERRTALVQTAASYVHEGRTDDAIQAVQKMYQVAEADGDRIAMAGDLNLMGNILLEAGRPGDAAAKFAKAVQTAEQADVPVEVKEANRRNALANEARIALARNDLATARAKAKAYADQAAAKKVPFEVRQSHELLGLIALQDKDYAAAVAELQQANQQDPRVLFSLAQAYRGKGEAPTARATLAKAADFNGLGFNYSFVRGKAKKMLGEG